MKQTIIITANPDNKSATFTAASKNAEGVDMFLTAEPWAIHIGEMPKDKRPFRITFGKYMPEYKITWDWDTKKIPPAVKQIQERVKDFLMNHKHMEVEGYNNRNLVSPMFKLRIIEDIEKKTYVLNKLYLNVINLVDNMSFQAKKDLVFFYGGNPTEFTEEQVWLDLVGFASGRLLNEGNAEIFMKSIGKEQEKEVSMRVYIKKAIHYGFIVTRDNKYYSQQNDLLGVSEDFIYQHYVGQPELYAYLVKEVDSREKVVASDSNTPKQEKPKQEKIKAQ